MPSTKPPLRGEKASKCNGCEYRSCPKWRPDWSEIRAEYGNVRCYAMMMLYYLRRRYSKI
jgi:hypothetical protein